MRPFIVIHFYVFAHRNFEIFDGTVVCPIQFLAFQNREEGFDHCVVMGRVRSGIRHFCDFGELLHAFLKKIVFTRRCGGFVGLLLKLKVQCTLGYTGIFRNLAN